MKNNGFNGWPNEFDEGVMWVVVLIFSSLAFVHFLLDVWGVM